MKCFLPEADYFLFSTVNKTPNFQSMSVRKKADWQEKRNISFNRPRIKMVPGKMGGWRSFHSTTKLQSSQDKKSSISETVSLKYKDIVN